MDQDGSLRRVVQRGLKRLGYRVILADESEFALKVLMKDLGEIQVVISNVVIPLAGHGTRYIFTGTRFTDAVIATLRSRTGTAFLPKPWTVGELDRGVKALLSPALRTE